MPGHRICTQKADHVSVLIPGPSRKVRSPPLRDLAACKTEDINVSFGKYIAKQGT